MVKEWQPPAPRTPAKEDWDESHEGAGTAPPSRRSNARAPSTRPRSGSKAAQRPVGDPRGPPSPPDRSAARRAQAVHPRGPGEPEPRWTAGDFTLIFVGGACFVLSYLTFSHGPILPDRVYPLWALFIALGAIATTGGALSVYVGPDPPSIQADEIDLEEFVLVPRKEWASIRERLSAAEGLARAEEEAGSGSAVEVFAPEPEAPPRRARSAEHRSILSDIEHLGGGGTPGAGAAGAAPSRTHQDFPGMPLERPVSATRLPFSSEPSPLRTSETAAPMEVEVPKVGDIAPETLQSALDAQLQDVLETPAAPGPIMENAPSEETERPTTRPEVPLPPAPARTQPEVVPASPGTSPSAPSSQTAVRPPPSGPESYSEDDEAIPAPTTGEAAAAPRASDGSADLDEIEQLAKMFASVAQPAGALTEEGTRPASSEPHPPGPRAEPRSDRELTTLRLGPSSPRYEWEGAALRAALDYCIDRNDGEPAETFLARVGTKLQQWTRSPPPPQIEMERARAFVDSILQAHHDLSRADLERAASPLRGRVEALGRAIGLAVRPEEPLVEFALRLKKVLEAAGPAEEDLPGPPPGPDTPPSALPPDTPPTGTPAPEGDIHPDALTAELDLLVQDLMDTTLPVSGTPTEPKPKRKGNRGGSGQT